MMIATGLATFLTGVTEPIEYMFMFVATPSATSASCLTPVVASVAEMCKASSTSAWTCKNVVSKK